MMGTAEAVASVNRMPLELVGAGNLLKLLHICSGVHSPDGVLSVVPFVRIVRLARMLQTHLPYLNNGMV